jgi:hypothetical protein
MEIVFSCAWCGKEFHNDARLAGKNARCKECGYIFVIPQPGFRPESGRSTPVPVVGYDVLGDDPYGLEDVPRVLKSAPPAAIEEEQEPILAWRAKPIAPKKAVEGRASSLNPGVPFFDGLPWFVYLIPPGVIAIGMLTAFVSHDLAGYVLYGGVALLFPISLYGLIGMFVVPFQEGLYYGTMCALLPINVLIYILGGDSRVLRSIFVASIPFFLGYVVRRWRAMKGAFLSLLYPIPILAAVAMMLPGFIQLIGAQPPATRASGYEGTITLNVGGVNDEADREMLGDKLNELAQKIPGGLQISGSWANHSSAYSISMLHPMSAQDFANQLTWARVTSVQGRVIEAEWQPSVDDESRPKDTDVIGRALADLRSPLLDRRKRGLNRFKDTQPDASRRVEVAKALEALLDEPDTLTRDDVPRALMVWGGKENTPALLRALADPNRFFRALVIEVFEKTKDSDAAEAVAALLPEEPDKASKALRAMGSPAESAVVPFLSASDASVRTEAAKILREIGTEKCREALRDVIRRSSGSGSDVDAAREALSRITLEAQSRH